MKIILNGNSREIKANSTILDLLNGLGRNPQAVVIELNEEIIKRDKWSKCILKSDDRIEIINFVGGG